MGTEHVLHIVFSFFNARYRKTMLKISDVRDAFFDALPSQMFELPMTREFHDLIISAMELDYGLDVLRDALLIKYN